MTDLSTQSPHLPTFTIRSTCFTACLATLILAIPHANAQQAPAVPPAPEANKTQPALPPVEQAESTSSLPDKAVTRPRKGRQVRTGGDWVMEITPAVSKPTNIDPNAYERIYNSIPFRRSEYLANPSYRHDTTVEIMFGKMRSTVIHRHDSPQRIVNPRPEPIQPGAYEFFEYWRYPGRFIQLLPGFGPVTAPRMTTF